MTELFVPRTNSFLQENERECKTLIRYSLELEQSGQLLDPESPEISPDLPKCAPQFHNSNGLVAKYDNATSKTSECFKKKSLSAIKL